MTQENRYVEMAKKIENRYLNCDGEDLPVHVKCNCLIHMITEALESVARERDAEIEKFYTGCKPTLLQKLHDLEKREHISGCYEIYGDCTCKDLHEKITQDLKQESLTHLKYLSDANKQLSEKEAEIVELKANLSIAQETINIDHKTMSDDFDSMKNLGEQIISLSQNLEQFKKSEKELSEAYLRIRTLVNAFDTNKGGENRFEITENKIKDLKQKLEKAVEALRYIFDNCDSEQEKWAEKTAEKALKEIEGGEIK